MKKKVAKDEPTSKTAKCFLLSEQLAIASNSIGEAMTQAAKSTYRGSSRRVYEAVRDAKYALATAALISDDIGRKAKSIVRELTKEETRALDAHAPREARHDRLDSALSKIQNDVSALRSRSARKCGVVRYDEPSDRGPELLRKMERDATKDLPPPPKGTVGYRAFDFKPIIRKKRR